MSKTNQPSASDYRIRRGTPADVPNLTRMRLALQKHMERRNGNIWKLSKNRIAQLPTFFRRLLRDRNAVVLVAEGFRDGVVGMAIGRILLHDEFLLKRSGKIDDVWVQPPHRRKGVCQSLMAEIARHFRKKHVELATLVYCLGNSEAEQTWKQFGFTPVLVSASADLNAISGFAGVPAQSRARLRRTVR